MNLAQSVVEALLFYHTAGWWVAGHIRAEREHCCDDAAIAVNGDAPCYVRAQASLAEAREERLQDGHGRERRLARRAHPADCRAERLNGGRLCRDRA